MPAPRTRLLLTCAAVSAAGALAVAATSPLLRPEAIAVATPAPARAFVVQKLEWRYVDRAEPLKQSDPPGAGHPVRVFPGRREAEQHRQALEAEARKGINPFYHPHEPGGDGALSFPSLEGVTGTPTGEFIDWLAAQKLNPPKGQEQAWRENMAKPKGSRTYFDARSFQAWRDWWDGLPRDEATLRRVWEKLDRVRFYEVVEVEVG